MLWGMYVIIVDYYVVLQVFFIDFEVVVVGLIVDQVVQVGYWIKVIDVEIGDVVMGVKFFVDGYIGRVCMVVDVDWGYLLGVIMVGLGVVELLYLVIVVVVGQVLIDWLWYVVLCFLIISELWLRFFEFY